MTKEQIAWAKLHDWFVADLGNGVVQVVDRYTIKGGPLQVDVISFNSFNALRVWAGY